jgi:hypothetical protein
MEGNVVTADLKAAGVRDSFDGVTGEGRPPASPRFSTPEPAHAEYLVLEAAAEPFTPDQVNPRIEVTLVEA